MKKVLVFCAAAVLSLPVFSGPARDGKTKRTVDNLYGLKIDEKSRPVACRSLPFLAAPSGERGRSLRTRTGSEEAIPVGSRAETLYLLGMINENWDYGLAHWGQHSELLTVPRRDQIQLGSRLGDIEIRYEDGSCDRIPVIVGYTAWFFNQWKYPSHDNVATTVIREPFASRPEYMAVLRNVLQLREEGEFMRPSENYRAYYLPVKPRDKKIESLVVRDNDALDGNILISGVTLGLPEGAEAGEGLVPFGKRSVATEDLQPAFASYRMPDYAAGIRDLSRILYTGPEDLPKQVDPLEFPEGFRAARIRFQGGAEAGMLSNIWVANLLDIDRKFDTESGCFYETGELSPFYGGYQGIGTWEEVGVYRQPYSRTSDHYVRQALRCIDDSARITSYVDFCDKWLYFYRPDHDPANGPDNSELNIENYPDDAPPHWAFVMNIPLQIPYPINEIEGDEEMEGHSSTAVARWYAWKLMGKPTGGWLTEPRGEVYGKSRWESTRDAADFICWLMDYTGRDVIYSEGEFTGWGSKYGMVSQIPEGMDTVSDPVKIRENYANSDMYEVYASYTSMTALRCSAEMAEALGESETARKYLAYADRIRTGMLRLLTVGSHRNLMWRVAHASVLPSLQDCLVQAWFSLYTEGLDPQRMDGTMTPITRNTLERQLNQPYGDRPVLGMGYGIGWLAHSALVLDRMDHAGRLLTNIARYTYDKNMDYADPDRGIDWRRWMWIIPEGSNVMPDGRWYRICDLGNGANQGPAMNALEVCAGADDADEERLRLLPRIPDPLTGVEVSDLPVVVREGDRCVRAVIGYVYERGKSFRFESDRTLARMDVRFGPYCDRESAERVAEAVAGACSAGVRCEQSGDYRGRPAFWVWAEGLEGVRSLCLEIEGL